VTSKGGSHDTSEHRSDGWGRVSQIMGLLSEVSAGNFRTLIGLKLRETKLCNGSLYNGEAWSFISVRDMARLEQVDLSFLRGLTGSHARTTSEFYYLELGILTFRHILTIRRLVYHHHILTRDSNETILKIYKNQKESHFKGDWYQTLLEDFRFIEEEKCDERICKFSKSDYTKYIKEKVEKAAFKSYILKKEIHKKKLGDLKYDRFQIQPYLNHKSFGKKEIQIMCLLRSKSHPAKNNFRKMNKNNLNCSLKCNSVETQNHIFENCKPILSKLKTPNPIQLSKIFGSIDDQCEVIDTIMNIEAIRKSMKENSYLGAQMPRPVLLQPQL
jgi:hypothetical protein